MRTNRRRIMKLISSYERIEYIESNGFSYIDTGIYGSNLLDIEISISSIGQIGFFLISRVSPYERTYGVVEQQGSNIRFDYYNKINHLGSFINKRITIRKSGLDIYVNNVLNQRLLEYNKFTNESGIYCFKNLINNKCYIGQAINLKKRLTKLLSLKEYKEG